MWEEGERKPGVPGAEKPSEQGKNQQQTQPTNHTGPESNQGHIDGRSAQTTALSLLPACSLRYTKTYFQSLKKFIHDVCDQHWSVIHALTVFH